MSSTAQSLRLLGVHLQRAKISTRKVKKVGGYAPRLVRAVGDEVCALCAYLVERRAEHARLSLEPASCWMSIMFWHGVVPERECAVVLYSQPCHHLHLPNTQRDKVRAEEGRRGEYTPERCPW